MSGEDCGEQIHGVVVVIEIQIRGYLAASDLLQREPSRWDALVILDRKAEATGFVPTHARRHHFLRFDDIDRAAEGRQQPSSEQIAAGLEFAAKSTQLLVSCRAGQSRSATMAFLIACQNLGINAAPNILDPRRHIPNSLVIQLGAKRLKMPEIEAAFNQWRNDHANTVLSDYYDEIEKEIDQLEASGEQNCCRLSCCESDGGVDCRNTHGQE